MINQEMIRLVRLRYHNTTRPSITRVLRGTSKEKLYQELGLEPIKRRWFRGICYFLQINYQTKACASFKLDPSKT